MVLAVPLPSPLPHLPPPPAHRSSVFVEKVPIFFSGFGFADVGGWVMAALAIRTPLSGKLVGGSHYQNEGLQAPVEVVKCCPQQVILENEAQEKHGGHIETPPQLVVIETPSQLVVLLSQVRVFVAAERG